MDRQQVQARATGWVRAWFAKIWKVRGGGLYAAGYALTFAFLEVRSFFGGFMESDSVADFVREEALEMAFRFLGETIGNMIQAFLWPVHVVQYRPPVGVFALVAAFLVFDRLLKKPIERWLFPEGAEEAAASPEEDR